MIYVCKEFALNNGSSVAKFLKYLDKTNQDLVITPRGEDPKAGTAQAPARQVSVRAADVGRNGIESIPIRRRMDINSTGVALSLVELPSGSLVRNWSRDHTLRIKKLLVDSGLIIKSLVRGGDLGLRSAKGTESLGVILTITYNLSTTRVDANRSMKCYALPYTRYEAISKLGLLADYRSSIIFVIQDGQVHMLTKH